MLSVKNNCPQVAWYSLLLVPKASPLTGLTKCRLLRRTNQCDNILTGRKNSRMRGIKTVEDTTEHGACCCARGSARGMIVAANTACVVA